MYISLAQLCIATLALVVLMFMAFCTGCVINAKSQDSRLHRIAREGGYVLLNGQRYKFLPSLEYLELVKKSASKPTWDWCTANGKER